jgi:hypothetical protein
MTWRSIGVVNARVNVNESIVRVITRRRDRRSNLKYGVCSCCGGEGDQLICTNVRVATSARCTDKNELVCWQTVRASFILTTRRGAHSRPRQNSIETGRGTICDREGSVSHRRIKTIKHSQPQATSLFATSPRIATTDDDVVWGGDRRYPASTI